MKQFKKVIPALMVSLPALAFAAEFSLIALIGKIKGAVQAIIPILFGVLVIYFLWGVIQFVTSGGDEEKRTTARNSMIYAVIGMFIAAAVWGLVAALGSFLGVDVGTGPSNLQGVYQVM